MTSNEPGNSRPSQTSYYLPKSITCSECKNTFVFSSIEQEFFHSQGFTHEPKKCPHCRLLVRMQREGKSTDSITKTNCAACGEQTSVPFRPKLEKDIYCTICYRTKRDSRLLAANIPSQQNSAT